MFNMLLALTAAISPQPGPVLQVQNPSPPRVRFAPGPARSIRFGPDIVVKEIRKDGTSAVRVLVANEGNADARQFQVDADASGPLVRATLSGVLPPIAGPLKSGASQWVAIGPFFTIAAPQHEIPLSDLTSVTVTADVYHGQMDMSGSLGAPAAPTPPSFGDDKSCTRERGCVVETNETNNVLTVPVSAMSDWTGG
jgi:hypothetical protein